MTRRITPSAFFSLDPLRVILYSTTSSCMAVPSQPLGMNISGKVSSEGITNPNPFLLPLYTPVKRSSFILL